MVSLKLEPRLMRILLVLLKPNIKFGKSGIIICVHDYVKQTAKVFKGWQYAQEKYNKL